MKPVFFCVNTYILFVLKPKSYSLLTLTLPKTIILRIASFSYISENQLRCTPSNYAGVCLQNTYDYSPFGVSLDGRTIDGDFYRRGFNGMEKDDEFKGKGNSYDFGARFLDVRLGRFLSIDIKAGKYTGLTPYNFVADNPIIYIDPDGNDIVYFDSKGNEERRIKSNIKFGARVDLKGNGVYYNAPMPNIIKGYEDSKYQKYDYIIAAETFIFNNTSPANRPKTENNLTLDGNQPVPLSPTLVKAIALEETGLGTKNGDAGQNGKNDIMQVNVTTSGGSDWNENKTKYGLEKNKSATVQQSIYAGIRILYTKGLRVSEAKYSNGIVSEDSKVKWSGDDLNSWWYAIRNYNGNSDIDSNNKPHKDNYVQEVTNYWVNSSFSQNSKYYVP